MNANGGVPTRWLVALCGVALGAVACARTPQFVAPVPPEVRANISRIGILEPPPLQFTYREPTPGAGAGYGRGVGACFGLLSSYPLGGFASLVVLAAALVGCPTVGGAVGAVANSSDAEVAEAQAALGRIGGENPFGDPLRGDLVFLLARDAPQYAVTLLAPDGTDALGAPVDTVVALDNPRVTLMQCNRRDMSIDPPLTLYATVDAELRRADTGAVVHHARIEYWGETFPFGVWAAAGADRFAQDLAVAQRSLAEQLVQSFFVAHGRMAMKWPFCRNQPWRKNWER